MRRNGHGKPVVAIDVDGTLTDYHGWFLRFAELWFGRPMPDPAKINPGLPLWKFMSVSRAAYRECKLAYRQGGMKRSMPVIEGAAEMIAAIRREAEVWICTTRPYLRLDNIDPDTRECLRRNGVRYDALLFDPVGGDNKYAELKRQAGRRVACVVEDLPEQVLKALRLKLLPVLLRDQPYNQPDYSRNGFDESKQPTLAHIDDYGVIRWDTTDKLLGLCFNAIEGWHRQ